MSTLAYGWVERCSDIAGCKASSSLKDKYFWLFHLCNYIDDKWIMMNMWMLECICCFRWMMGNHVLNDCVSSYALCILVCICMLMNYVSLYDGLCILVCIVFKFLISAFNPCSCSWGCFPVCIGVRHVLFVGRRDGYVTEWYQRSCCNMGLNGPPRCSDRGKISFCPAEIESWWQKTSTKIV